MTRRGPQGNFNIEHFILISPALSHRLTPETSNAQYSISQIGIIANILQIPAHTPLLGRVGLQTY